MSRLNISAYVYECVSVTEGKYNTESLLVSPICSGTHTFWHQQKYCLIMIRKVSNIYSPLKYLLSQRVDLCIDREYTAYMLHQTVVYLWELDAKLLNLKGEDIIKSPSYTHTHHTHTQNRVVMKTLFYKRPHTQTYSRCHIISGSLAGVTSLAVWGVNQSELSPPSPHAHTHTHTHSDASFITELLCVISAVSGHYLQSKVIQQSPLGSIFAHCRSECRWISNLVWPFFSQTGCRPGWRWYQEVCW